MSIRKRVNRELSRRAFLRYGSAALIAAPFAQVALRAKAATPLNAQRILFFFTPDGVAHQHWQPSYSGGTLSFAEHSMTAPLAAIADDLLFLDGLNFQGTGSSHESGMAAMLTGAPNPVNNGISVDQYIAAQIGGAAPFQSIELGVQTGPASREKSMSFAASGDPIQPDNNPISAYQRLFNPVTEEAGSVDRGRLLKTSMLDLMSRQLIRLHNDLGVEERIKLSAHLDSIRDMEKSLDFELPDCEQPTAPEVGGFQEQALFPEVGKAHMDLLIAAFSCGLTRVGSLMWSHTISGLVMTWTGMLESLHASSHYPDSYTEGLERFVAGKRWFAEQFLYLITRLKEAPDPIHGGNLLDTTTVVWCNELGDGRLHATERVPFVLAGGAFNTGRLIDFEGQSHMKLLVSLCQTMGVMTNSFGIGGDDVGPLEGLV